ncbi:hypothetical protein CEK26_011930 [Fusarium fujikuroi]|nr:hypothetical protein CEK27_011947 [Fusarium fujikuroi]QGI85207.1 hypothetical protein CEK25_011936 [Fusarium fujikuroi]QGI98861.1 hypothetical protein CEK26_011930 [Fusarium fujikuroi]VTT61367.1 unnamed protein product [Fusarium fujikuroi]VZH90078.1 unnamed protein product [Fusarium fujikuroi]
MEDPVMNPVPKRGHGGAYVGHGNGGGGRVRLGGLFASRIGEAERAWQLYQLTGILTTNQRLPKRQGQRSETQELRDNVLGAADRWNVPMWTPPQFEPNSDSAGAEVFNPRCFASNFIRVALPLASSDTASLF